MLGGWCHRCACDTSSLNQRALAGAVLRAVSVCVLLLVDKFGTGLSNRRQSERTLSPLEPRLAPP